MKYRKLPITIEATRWFKNGDHPEDCSTLIHPPEKYRDDVPRPEPFLSEGKVVRYFRRPDVMGSSACPYCPHVMHEHGWIDTVQGGHRVCPGDWIITDSRVEDPRGHGHYYPCKPDVFAATYEEASMCEGCGKEPGDGFDGPGETLLCKTCRGGLAAADTSEKNADTPRSNSAYKAGIHQLYARSCTLERELVEARERLAEETRSLEFCRWWWGTRSEVLSQWVRANKATLPEEFIYQYFSVIANGQPSPTECPPYAAQLNMATYRAERAEKEIERLRGAAQRYMNECPADSDLTDEFLQASEALKEVLAQTPAGAGVGSSQQVATAETGSYRPDRLHD